MSPLAEVDGLEMDGTRRGCVVGSCDMVCGAGWGLVVDGLAGTLVVELVAELWANEKRGTDGFGGNIEGEFDKELVVAACHCLGVS